MLQARSLYDLNRAFKTSLGLFYSASLGSLRMTALRLQARGWVSCTETTTGRRVRKEFRLLPAGRDAFLAEFQAPITPSKLEVTALTRVFFLGLLPDRAARIAVVSQLQTAVDEATSDLARQGEHLDALAIPPEAALVFRFQRATLDYGLTAHRAASEWFRHLAQDVARQ